MLYILANFVGRRLGNKEIFRKHETPPFDFKETVQESFWLIYKGTRRQTFISNYDLNVEGYVFLT